jgi:hypothetical protein
VAYEYDRLEREDGSGSFLMGLLAGTVLGAGLGMLFAPKSGTELRSQLSESASRLRATANDSYQQASERVGEKVSQIVDRGREAYERGKATVAGAAGSTAGSTGTTVPSAMPTQPSSPLSGTGVGTRYPGTDLGTGGYPNNRG